jgi:hypothetical protein
MTSPDNTPPLHHTQRMPVQQRFKLVEITVVVVQQHWSGQNDGRRSGSGGDGGGGSDLVNVVETALAFTVVFLEELVSRKRAMQINIDNLDTVVDY